VVEKRSSLKWKGTAVVPGLNGKRGKNRSKSCSRGAIRRKGQAKGPSSCPKPAGERRGVMALGGKREF